MRRTFPWSLIVLGLLLSFTVTAPALSQTPEESADSSEEASAEPGAEQDEDGEEGEDGDDGDEGDEGRRVFLSVTDGGPALDAAEVATLFESFPRSTRAERTVYELGLGASLVARIARAHGWTATVNRMGNTITVSIPAAPGADAQI